MITNFYVYKRKVSYDIDDVVDTNWKSINLISEQQYSEASDSIKNNYINNTYSYFSLYTTYFQALETMFGLLSAIVQAPYFVYGWLLEYRNQELMDMVTKIQNKLPIYNAHNREVITWKDISLIVHPKNDTDEDRIIIDSYALVWERLALDFLSNDFQECYKSIKHGCRAKKDAIKNMTIAEMYFEGSEYGFQYGVIRNNNGCKEIRYKIVNINPTIAFYTFEIVKGTIYNIKEFVKTVNYKGEKTVSQYVLNKDTVSEFMNINRPKLLSFTSNQVM